MGEALHRVRSRLISNRTAVINQIRGFLLEHGIPVRQGHHFLRKQLPQLLAARADVLSPRMIRIIGDLMADWNYLDERIERLTDEIEALARADEGCQQLITVPGIGPIISSAMVAAIGNGAAFCKGRDFAAWLGLVPKQMSTGDRTILGRITKRGNRHLRMLFIQGARAILLRPASWAKHSFGSWLAAAARRLHRNVLSVALANKLARIAWTVLAQGRRYEARVEPRVARHRGQVQDGALTSTATKTGRFLPRSASWIEEMEKRSHRRIRDLDVLAAFQGLVANEIGCARISMMAREQNTPFNGPNTDARDQLSPDRHIQLAPHGRSIQST